MPTYLLRGRPFSAKMSGKLHSAVSVCCEKSRPNNPLLQRLKIVSPIGHFPAPPIRIPQVLFGPFQLFYTSVEQVTLPLEPQSTGLLLGHFSWEEQLFSLPSPEAVYLTPSFL